MEIIRDNEYLNVMKQDVEPYLNNRRETGTFERLQGQPLYYEHFTADYPAASVVLVHGFSEGIDKFRETVWYFLQNGFHVWLLQQREHGKSYRSTKDPYLIYIDDYGKLIEDLHAFVTDVVKPAVRKEGLPLYLFGHSMGGGVSACLLERYPDDFKKAVLSSPMLEMNAGGTPVWAAALYAKLLIFLGRGQNYMPGTAGFSMEPDFENSCTTCRERYDEWFGEQKAHKEWQMCASAVRTALEFLRLTQEAVNPSGCRKVTADVLLLQAGKDTMVGSGGQDAFITQIPHGKKVQFPKAKHEIYREKAEILETYWREILAFLR